MDTYSTYNHCNLSRADLEAEIARVPLEIDERKNMVAFLQSGMRAGMNVGILEHDGETDTSARLQRNFHEQAVSEFAERMKLTDEKRHLGYLLARFGFKHGQNYGFREVALYGHVDKRPEFFHLGIDECMILVGALGFKKELEEYRKIAPKPDN